MIFATKKGFFIGFTRLYSLCLHHMDNMFEYTMKISGFDCEKNKQKELQTYCMHHIYNVFQTLHHPWSTCLVSRLYNLFAFHLHWTRLFHFIVIKSLYLTFFSFIHAINKESFYFLCTYDSRRFLIGLHHIDQCFGVANAYQLFVWNSQDGSDTPMTHIDPVFSLRFFFASGHFVIMVMNW